MQGLHLTADLYQCRCDAAWLTDAAHLGAWCVQAVQAAGLQPVNQLFHTFPATPRGPGGVTQGMEQDRLEQALTRSDRSGNT